MKYLSVKEFIKDGFLQEVNRQFFHPLGLALAVPVGDEESEEFANGQFIVAVQDAREDAEGFIFAWERSMLTPERIADIRKKRRAVQELRQSKLAARRELLQSSNTVQPVPF